MMRLCAASFFCLTIIAPLILSQYEFSSLQVLLAMVLLGVCLYPSYRYVMQDSAGVPVLPLLCLAYAAQFAIPIFTRDAVMSLAYDDAILENEEVVMALVMTIIGVCVMQLAYHLLQTKKINKVLPAINLPLNVNRAKLYCVFIFALAQILSLVELFLPIEFKSPLSSFIALFQNQVLVAIGILSWVVYKKHGNKWLKVLLYIIVGITIVRNASTTMLESILIPIAVLFTTRWIYTRRVPIFGFIFIGLIVVFLSPVKGDIRKSAATENAVAADSSVTNRAVQWFGQATDYWVAVFTENRGLLESASDTTSRTDLIHQFAYIYASTPERVPYQYGESYKYFAVALIPRVLWPGKPTANSANTFYAINYGVSTEQILETSTFGVTLIGEGYMNFGFFGVLLVMFMQGTVLSLLEQIFAGRKAGAGGWAIFIATLVYLLNGIGSSAEVMFGAVLQNLIASCILLWWIREKPSTIRIAILRTARLALEK